MRKQLHYVTLLLLFINTNTFAGENYVDLYINTYKDIAIKEMIRSGIPASITLAQGIQESSWGRGALAINSNNHFGIKCKDYWTGQTFYYEDDDFDRNGKLIKSCFRAYESPEKSYIDHTDFLMNTAHYQELFNYSNTDYIRWARGLKKCGYATDKEYANKLIRTIETYQLNKYDVLNEVPLLVSMPVINHPKNNIDKLVIRTDRNEETKYSAMYVPAAIPIPDDYERKFENFAKTTFIEREIRQEMEVLEKVLPARKETVKSEAEEISFSNEEGIISTPITHAESVKKESIIPSAFASTKRIYHLTRIPRQSNSALR